MGRIDPCRTLKCSYGQRCVLDSLGEAQCICSGENECSEDFNEPVCGSDWRDYPSICHVRKASCLSNQNIVVKYKGMCGKYTESNNFITETHNIYNNFLIQKCNELFSYGHGVVDRKMCFVVGANLLF